jgi:hypothetical protein
MENFVKIMAEALVADPNQMEYGRNVFDVVEDLMTSERFECEFLFDVCEKWHAMKIAAMTVDEFRAYVENVGLQQSIEYTETPPAMSFAAMADDWWSNENNPF